MSDNVLSSRNERVYIFYTYIQLCDALPCSCKHEKCIQLSNSENIETLTDGHFDDSNFVEQICKI